VRALARTLICAWVLWANPGNGWTPVTAFDARAECIARLEKAYGYLADSVLIDRNGSATIIDDTGKGVTIIAARCLPDMVKP
jgi:hypothetical protein